MLDGFLLSIKGSSVAFIGGVVRDVFQALKEGSLSTDGRLLPQSFIGDGVTSKTFESNCFLATGNDSTSGVFSGSNKLMVVKWCFDMIAFIGKFNVNEDTGSSLIQKVGLTILLTDKYVVYSHYPRDW